MKVKEGRLAIALVYVDDLIITGDYSEKIQRSLIDLDALKRILRYVNDTINLGIIYKEIKTVRLWDIVTLTMPRIVARGGQPLDTSL